MRRPPPGVGIARRALQHSRPGSHHGAAARSPLLFLLRVVGRTLAATWWVEPRRGKGAPCGENCGGVGLSRGGPGGEKRGSREVGSVAGSGMQNREGAGVVPFVRLPRPGELVVVHGRVAGRDARGRRCGWRGARSGRHGLVCGGFRAWPGPGG